MENPIKMDDLAVPLFLETPIWCSSIRLVPTDVLLPCIAFHCTKFSVFLVSFYHIGKVVLLLQSHRHFQFRWNHPIPRYHRRLGLLETTIAPENWWLKRRLVLICAWHLGTCYVNFTFIPLAVNIRVFKLLNFQLTQNFSGWLIVAQHQFWWVAMFRANMRTAGRKMVRGSLSKGTNICQSQRKSFSPTFQPGLFRRYHPAILAILVTRFEATP